MSLDNPEARRGLLRNPEYNNKNIWNYAGLQYGKATPTDIDSFMELQDKAFLFLEYKRSGSELPLGQKIALERLVDAITKPSLLIIAEWDDSIPQPIDIGKLLVVSYRYQKQTRTPEQPTTCKMIADWFFNKHVFQAIEASPPG